MQPMTVPCWVLLDEDGRVAIEKGGDRRPRVFLKMRWAVNVNKNYYGGSLRVVKAISTITAAPEKETP